MIYPAFRLVSRGGLLSDGRVCLLWPSACFPANIYVFNPPSVGVYLRLAFWVLFASLFGCLRWCFIPGVEILAKAFRQVSGPVMISLLKYTCLGKMKAHL